MNATIKIIIIPDWNHNGSFISYADISFTNADSESIRVFCGVSNYYKMMIFFDMIYDLDIISRLPENHAIVRRKKIEKISYLFLEVVISNYYNGLFKEF
jgi:hypothetical protein